MTQDVDLADLERYLRIYQENPDSRVFAPLADMYRRLARFREAEQVSREGLLRHPYYAGGKVALAHVLLDTERLQEAAEIIEEVVTFYPDNLLARRILIKTLAGLGHWERAHREWSALKILAPGLADDPELKKILSAGMAATLRTSGATQKSSPRDLRRRQLLRKKAILESWIQALDSGSLTSPPFSS